MKKSKKLLLFCQSLCLILALCATGVSAQSYAPTTYDALATAINDAVSGETITVGALAGEYAPDATLPVLIVKPGVTLHFTADITLPENLLIFFNYDDTNGSAKLEITDGKTIISNANWHNESIPEEYQYMDPGFNFKNYGAIDIFGLFTTYNILDEVQWQLEPGAGYYFNDENTMKDALNDAAVQNMDVINATFFKGFTIAENETFRINYFDLPSGKTMAINGTLENYMNDIFGTVTVGATGTFKGETIKVWGTLDNKGSVEPIFDQGKLNVYKMYQSNAVFGTVLSAVGKLDTKWAVNQWDTLVAYNSDTTRPATDDVYLIDNHTIKNDIGRVSTPLTFRMKVHFVDGLTVTNGAQIHLKGNFCNEGFLQIEATWDDENYKTGGLYFTGDSTLTNEAGAGIEIRSLRALEDPETIHNAVFIVAGNMTNNGWINCDGKGEVRGEFTKGTDSEVNGNLKYNHLYFNRLDNFEGFLWSESQNPENQTTLITTPDRDENLIFYKQVYENNDWNNNPIPVTDLEGLSNFPGVIEAVEITSIEIGQTNGDCFACISQVDWGEYQIGLKSDNRFAVDVISALPEIAYYKAAAVSEDNYISDFPYTPTAHEFYFGINSDKTDEYMDFKAIYFSYKYDSAADKTFYYGIDGTTVVYTVDGKADESLEDDELRTLSEDFALSALSAEKIADKNMWKLTVAEDCEAEFSLGIGAIFERTDDMGSHVEMRDNWIYIYPGIDYEGLFWAYCDWENDLPKSITDDDIDRGSSISLGKYTGAFVYRSYDDANKQWINETIDCGDISVNTTAVTMEDYQWNGSTTPTGKFSDLTLLKTGNYEFSYTNGADETFKLKLKVIQPRCGYYAENTASDETYLQQLAYFDSANQSFYLIFNDVEGGIIYDKDMAFRIENGPQGKDISDLLTTERVGTTNVWKFTLKDGLNCRFDLITEFEIVTYEDENTRETSEGDCRINIGRFDGMMWAEASVTDFTDLSNLSSTINIGNGESKSGKLIHIFYGENGDLQIDPINQINQSFIAAAKGLNCQFDENGIVTIMVAPESILGEYRIYKRNSEGGTPGNTYGMPLLITNLGPYTITATAGTGGSITPANPQVSHGEDQVFTITPNTGYKIKDVTVDGVSKGAISTFTFTSVTATHTINATFEKQTFAITTTAGTGGTISPANSAVAYGADQAFTITPNTGYKIKDVTVDGVSKGATTSFTFTNVTATHTIAATFEKLTFAITTTVGANGTMTPLNPTVAYGDSKTFTITPNDGFEVDAVIVDGVAQGAVTEYTFTDVTATHTIAVTFKEKTPTENKFTDVVPGKYYYNAVLWAVDKNITKGTSDTTFGPDDACTRCQVVTFIWSAMGRPEPTSLNNPFTDVKEGKYYYKAVLWAVEKNITKGMTANTFEPDATVTRAQFVTFLWSAEGKPEVTIANPFNDIVEGKYYYKAVMWAVSTKVTSGTSDNTFSPNDPCTRGQVVSFLYRDLGKK